MSKRINDNQAGGEHVLEQLSAYIDNALDAGERERVRAHIEACEGCRAEHRELQATKQMLFDLPVAKPPRAFTLTQEMVAAKPSLWQRLRVPRWYPRLATGSVVAFALLVLVLLGDFAGSRSMNAEVVPAPAASGHDAFVLATPDAAYKNFSSTTPTAATQAAAEEAPASTAMVVSNDVEPAHAIPPATGGAAPEATPAGDPAANQAQAPTLTVTGAEYDSAPVAQATAAMAEGAGAERGVEGYVSIHSAPPAGQPMADSPLSDNDVSWAFILQVSLAVLGVALGVGAIIARVRGV